MSMNEIRAMREKRVKLWEAAKAFVESRKDVSGTLSAEDSATYDQMEADVIRMGKEIERLERQEALDLEFDRPTARTLTDKPIAPEGKTEKTGRASDSYKAAFWRTMRDKAVPHEVLNALQVGTDSEGGYPLSFGRCARHVGAVSGQEMVHFYLGRIRLPQYLSGPESLHLRTP